MTRPVQSRLIGHMKARLASIVFLLPAALAAGEANLTTDEILAAAPNIAHVKVVSSREIPGFTRTVEYTVAVIEVMKGDLPPTFEMRVMHASRSLSPSGQKDPEGAEWLVILGEKNEFGIYPVRSVSFGRIDIVTDQVTGQQTIARPLPDFEKPGFRYVPLDEFRAGMKKRGFHPSGKSRGKGGRK